jgi:hypothetical protein
LEHRDRDRLSQKHASHQPAPPPHRKRTPAHQEADAASTRQTKDSVPASVGVSSPLEHPTPCMDALLALREVPMDPEAESAYHRLRELCLRGAGRDHARVSAPGPGIPDG